MRASRTSGSRSGRWKRSTVELLRHRRTKGPATDRFHLNHRATSRLYTLRLHDGGRNHPQVLGLRAAWRRAVIAEESVVASTYNGRRSAGNLKKECCRRRSPDRVEPMVG